MTTMAQVPGTMEWVMARIDLRAELKIRKVLRQLERDADARLVGLWALTEPECQLISFAGDTQATPVRVPAPDSSVVSRIDLATRSGCAEPTVLLPVVVGQRLPRLHLIIVAPGVTWSEAFLKLVEDAGDRVEAILVSALGRK